MEPLESLLAFIAESAKILHMDASLSSLHSNLQRTLASHHRIANPESSYYDYPTVQDVYGDESSGQVVYSKNGAHSRSDFKKGPDGSYSLSNHKPVKKAYVAEAVLTQESDIQEVLDVQEAALNVDGKGEICLIKPCTGSMGHYTSESLQRTATNGVFGKGTKMFIDHQTEEERKARPEGSVLRTAAVLEGAAQWKEGKAGWGLYAPIRAYSDFVPFINERAKDIGVSVRGSIIPTGKIVNGVPEVQEFARALSVDFVTKAGAGGKLISVYESYREQRGIPIQEREGVIDMEVKESDFKALQDQAALVPKLITRLDRVEEQNRRFQVQGLVSRLVAESKLPLPSQNRLTKPFLAATYVAPVKDEVLDLVALEAQVKEAITDETKYLQESGILRTNPITNNGAGDGTEKKLTDDQLAQEADRQLQDASRELGGLPVLERKAAV